MILLVTSNYIYSIAHCRESPGQNTCTYVDMQIVSMTRLHWKIHVLIWSSHELSFGQPGFVENQLFLRFKSTAKVGKGLYTCTVA